VDEAGLLEVVGGLYFWEVGGRRREEGGGQEEEEEGERLVFVFFFRREQKENSKKKKKIKFYSLPSTASRASPESHTTWAAG